MCWPVCCLCRPPALSRDVSVCPILSCDERMGGYRGRHRRHGRTALLDLKAYFPVLDRTVCGMLSGWRVGRSDADEGIGLK
jgi:hypothetical protein